VCYIFGLLGCTNKNYIAIATIAYIRETFFRAIAYKGLYILELHPKAKHAKTTQNMQNDTYTSLVNDISPTYNKGESED
jgi:hypothetical protein